MEIRVLGSAGGQVPGFDTTGFRIGTDLLLDAGAIGLVLSLEEQRAIRHVLLTHAHLDHVHALPFLLDNLIGRIPDSVAVYGSDETLGLLRRHIFNGELWPDFTALPTPAAPVLRLQAVAPDRPFRSGGYEVEAVAVAHTVPAVGYLVTGADGTVVFTGDTGYTEEVWARAARAGRLRAVFAEASFPTSLQELAERTRHLTPTDVARALERAGIPAGTPVFLYHVKPEYTEAVAREAAAISPWRTRVLLPNETIRL